MRLNSVIRLATGAESGLVVYSGHAVCVCVCVRVCVWVGGYGCGCGCVKEIDVKHAMESLGL